MVPQPTLVSSRFKLRPFEVADAARVAELANDEELSRNLRSFVFPYSVDDAREWLGGLSSEWEAGKSAVFAICFRELVSDPSGLVGAIGVVLDQQSNRGELGYWIGRKYWGKGVATEASRSILDFAFGQLGLNKVVAESLDRNPASSAVLEKVGMVQEGYLKRHFRKNETDDYSDVRVFGLLKSTWNQRSNAGI